MKTKIFEQSGKSKSELINILEKVKLKYASKIEKNEISINRYGDTFNIYAVKDYILMKFWVDANIILEDGSITINYKTNIPETKEKDFLKLIEREIISESN